jgi:hypothetical protein
LLNGNPALLDDQLPPQPVVGLNNTCGGGNCGVDRTKTIIKSVCAAAVASAPMLLQ